MLYKGYKIRVRCINWEQKNTINKYWNIFTSYVKNEKIIGLGMNWAQDYLYFDYAIGVIDDEKTLNKIKTINFSNLGFNVDYIEINLPTMEEWTTFKGKKDNLEQIYEKEIDCYLKSYDYELEYLDSYDNIEIKIHFI